MVLFDKEYRSGGCEYLMKNRSIFVVISREGFFRISYGISQIYKLYAGVGKVRTNIPAYDVEKYCQKSEVDKCVSGSNR